MINVIKIQDGILQKEKIEKDIIGNDITIPLKQTEENKVAYVDTYLQLRDEVDYRSFTSDFPPILFLIVQGKGEEIYNYSGNYNYYLCAKVLTEDESFEYAYQPIELDESEILAVGKFLSENKDVKEMMKIFSISLIKQEIMQYNLCLYQENYYPDSETYKSTWVSNQKPISVCIAILNDRGVLKSYKYKYGY